jgi:Recombination endonuclease VII
LKICKLDKCERKAKSRGLCASHYVTHLRRGDLDLIGDPYAPYHRTSNVNIDTKLGDCSVCGSNVLMVFQKGNGKGRWQCRPKEQQRWQARSTSFPYGNGQFIPVKDVQEARHRLLKEQNGLCAICGNKESERRLALDHCHDTGKIRGLLCGTCNTGIGMLKDSVELLEAATKYLSK